MIDRSAAMSQEKKGMSVVQHPNSKVLFNDFMTKRWGLKGAQSPPEWLFESTLDKSTNTMWWHAQLIDGKGKYQATAKTKSEAKRMCTEKFMDAVEKIDSPNIGIPALTVNPPTVLDYEHENDELPPLRDAKGQFVTVASCSSDNLSVFSRDEEWTTDDQSIAVLDDWCTRVIGMVSPTITVAPDLKTVHMTHPCFIQGHDHATLVFDVPNEMQKTQRDCRQAAAKYVLDHKTTLFDKRVFLCDLNASPDNKEIQAPLSDAWKEFSDKFSMEKKNIVYATDSKTMTDWLTSHVLTRVKAGQSPTLGLDIKPYLGSSIHMIQLATEDNILVYNIAQDAEKTQDTTALTHILSSKAVKKSVLCDWCGGNVWLQRNGLVNTIEIDQRANFYGFHPNAGLHRYVRWFLGKHLNSMPNMLMCDWTKPQLPHLAIQHAASTAYFAFQLGTCEALRG